MKKFQEDKFCNDLKLELNKLPTNVSQLSNNIDYHFNNFLNCIESVTNKHAPVVNMTKNDIKTSLKPWITKGILKSYKTKTKLYKKKLINKSAQDNLKYKKFSNLLTHTKNASKVLYYQKLFNESNNNPQKTWKNINDIIRYKKTTVNTIDSLRNNDQIINDAQEMGNLMNDYFINIGTKLGDSCNIQKSLNNDTITSDMENSFFLNPVSVHYVEKLIRNLDPKKSNGPDQIPNKFIIMASKIIAPILTNLINSCFLTGIFPKIIKISTVIPLYKSGDPQLLTNHRPISLTNPFSKIMERCIYNQLDKFIKKYNIIHPQQYGFQKGMSTEMAIAEVYDKLAEKKDSKEITCALFLDIRKAFDSVNHELLLTKLSRYGIRGTPLKLLTSFLKDRMQAVFINGTKSNYMEIKCGVPQGSVLGPLLFLLFINDLPNVSNVFSTLLFADDACMIASSPSPIILQNLVNQELKKISTWMSKNKICLNYNKTVFLILSNRNLTYKFNILIDNSIIKEEQQVKYVGVIFDNKLSWSPHVLNITKKISKGCWAIANLKKYTNPKILRLVYFSLVYPHLHYGITCWGSAAKYIINKLYIKQKWAIKIMTNSKLQERSTPLFFRLHVLKLEDIFKLKLVMEIRRLILNNSLSKFNLKFSKTTHSYSTRTSCNDNLTIPRVNTNIGKTTLKYVGAVTWNGLPSEFRVKSVAGLKFYYKKWMIENYAN